MKIRLAREKRRAGTSLIEVQVAFVVFGIMLSGIAPLVIMHMKQVHKLEQRFSDESIYYLTPSSKAWAQKLGAAATISVNEPEGAEAVSETPSNDVQILSVEMPFASEEVSAIISVNPISP